MATRARDVDTRYKNGNGSEKVSGKPLLVYVSAGYGLFLP